MSKTSEAKPRAPRKPMPEKPLMVGKWVLSNPDDPSSPKVFRPEATQPEAPITDMAEMLAWTKKAFAEIPGAYEFIRVIPGAQTLARQTVLDARWTG